MRRVLVTGGSGFIGTNLVGSLLNDESAVLSIDVKEPQDKEHDRVFQRADIRDGAAIVGAFERFRPTHVVHLAARTDLDKKARLQDYDANTKGVENIVDAVSRQPSVKRCIFASTKLVCPTDHQVESENDYCPDTVYGQSKVVGEKIVRNSARLRCDWCIVRPTSIWGPWCDVPYGKFFRMVGRNRYFHPGHANPPRSFGYVGNAVFQIEKILEAPREQIHQNIFYISDYDTFTIRDWADTISMKMRNRNVRTMSEPLVRLLAWAGDAMKLCGVKEPPLSSFRLRNMRADTTGIPIEPTERLTGPLPFSMEQGVEGTIAWLKTHDHTNLPSRGRSSILSERP